jgi:hypothetical protein
VKVPPDAQLRPKHAKKISAFARFVHTKPGDLTPI